MITNLQVYPINSKEFLDLVIQAGNADGRHPLYPTHAIIKDEEIVGAFCTFSPTVYWWMHSTKITNRDSVTIFQSLDTLMNQENHDSYVIPCHPTSSYYKTLTSRIGDGLQEYKGDGDDDWTLFIRK
tara:strand:+ start:10173 stop:10553 length:381 start_codon:yes stop_codon:yes gene_type:complete